MAWLFCKPRNRVRLAITYSWARASLAKRNKLKPASHETFSANCSLLVCSACNLKLVQSGCFFACWLHTELFQKIFQVGRLCCARKCQPRQWTLEPNSWAVIFQLQLRCKQKWLTIILLHKLSLEFGRHILFIHCRKELNMQKQNISWYIVSMRMTPTW